MESSRSVFKARNLRCPQAARALHLVCQNDKVESSMCAEKILRSGEKYRCPQAARAIRLVCQNDKVEPSRSFFKARDLRCPRTSSRCPSSLSKWQSGVLEEHFKARDLRCPRTSSRCPSSLPKWQSGVLEERWKDTRKRGKVPLSQNPPLYLSHVLGELKMH